MKHACRAAILIWVVNISATASLAAAPSRAVVDLSGPGWKLWLDKDAAWKNDKLFPPGTDLSQIPSNPPTGGWGQLDSVPAIDASVPGTDQEYLEHGEGPEGAIFGVTWWFRTIHIPPSDSPRKMILRFESTRQRAEIYLDQKLVGYDIVGNSPFEVDLSAAARPGTECRLAVRITNPGGNFDYHDTTALKWGRYKFPLSHGFGGITGRVSLIALDAAYLADTYVQNTPVLNQANAILTIRNSTSANVARDLLVRVFEARDRSAAVFEQTVKNVELAPGDNIVPVKISVPSAKVWDLDHPNLYVCQAALQSGNSQTDIDEKVFGFRWFEAVGEGSDAMFRLNGKRIVTRSAISWGYWPISGLDPTPELAERQIRAARDFGLNMLNFHRAIGNPIVMEKADQLGLLYYEEPGSYVSGDGDEFCQSLCREKWLRMIRRDRSHPSVVIFTMINESWDGHGAASRPDILAGHVRDLKDAHAIDPSRMILHTSAWVGPHRDRVIVGDDPARIHMLPFDDSVHPAGFYDYHHAGGPAVWNQKFYTDPAHYYGNTTNAADIMFNGEEGAISTPPRLALIKEELAKSPRLGWDGAVYLDWYKQFDEFLAHKNLRDAFPTVDSLCVSMGNISMYHQGRKIENLRMNNLNDDYTINGWEAELADNHSGIVDCFRNPKGDASILAYYNQPAYVAVKARQEVAQIPGKSTVDFFAINEVNLKGAMTLKVSATNPNGKPVFFREIPVKLTGGDVYGQLLAEGIEIPIEGAPGMFNIEANLLDSSGKSQAAGHEQVFAVDWKSSKISPAGAVWEDNNRIATFLAGGKGMKIPEYNDNSGKLDWIAVDRAPETAQVAAIPPEQLRDPTGEKSGLIASFFAGDFQNQLAARTDANVDLSLPAGAAPDPNFPGIENYCIRWTGKLVPKVSGRHTFQIESTGGVRLTLGGQSIIDALKKTGAQTSKADATLEAGKPVDIIVEFSQATGAAKCKLCWQLPGAAGPDLAKLFARVKNDGTTLLIMSHADEWMKPIAQNSSVTYKGAFQVGTAWTGGALFVKKHPLFKDLPVNCAMDWPYQALQDLAGNGKNRTGLLLDGEELVAGAWHCYPMQLGTTVGIIPCGKGRIVVNTLDICQNLSENNGPAEIARKIFCNFLEFSAYP